MGMVEKMKKAVIIISMFFIEFSLNALTYEEFITLSFDEQFSRYERLDLYQGQFPKGSASNYLANTYGEKLFGPVFQHLNAYSVDNEDELFYIENLMYLTWVMKEKGLSEYRIRLICNILQTKLIAYLLNTNTIDSVVIEIETCLTRVFPDYGVEQSFPPTGIKEQEYYEELLGIPIEITFNFKEILNKQGINLPDF